MLDVESMQTAANAIKKAGKVVFYGLGDSGLIARAHVSRKVANLRRQENTRISVLGKPPPKKTARAFYLISLLTPK